MSRAFAVAPDGTTTLLRDVDSRLAHMGVTPAMNAAYDVLDAAGMLDADRLETLIRMERTGEDPLRIAKRLVYLRDAAREMAAERP